MPLPDVKLGKIFGKAWRYGVLAAAFGPLALGVAQCSSDNDYDPWDRRALDSYIDNVGETYYWELRKGRQLFEWAGSKLPDFTR